MQLDLTIVSGSRPDLLAKTMQSFHQNLFQNIEFKNVLANIDLFGGNETDRHTCAEIIKSYFPECKFNLPSQCSFGKAVKWLWENTESDHVFHLEDDWILHEPVHLQDITPLFDKSTTAVTLLSREHGNGRRRSKDGTFVQTKAFKKKLFGLTIWKSRVNRHGTSPGFLLGDFARTYASYINTDLDPEKQNELHINPELFRYTTQFQRKMLMGKKRREIIEDIGRPWRDNKKLKKAVVDGKSIWVTS